MEPESDNEQKEGIFTSGFKLEGMLNQDYFQTDKKEDIKEDEDSFEILENSENEAQESEKDDKEKE